ncbi:MAG: MoxR family ATPase [Acidimicrobiia bacterium]|nr:MoxR family ATPase [Acidimicrobiia bacterium]
MTTERSPMRGLRSRVQQEVSKVVMGQTAALDALLAAVAVGGHVLLEGVPGTAKTLMANAFARAVGLDFSRAQFTPDMLPSDLTGTMTLRGGDLVFRPGPVFSNVLLADEINRTPPKTQSALLEAMAENQVSVDGTTHALPSPFMVVATQNPVEYEGTYPLPEAQLDRFLMKIQVGYPGAEHELEMLRMSRDGVRPTAIDDVVAVTGAEELLSMRNRVSSLRIEDEVLDYLAKVVAATRSQPSVELGASPRAAVHLLAASRAIAAMAGRDYVTPDDVSRMSLPVLNHRILIRPEAEIERYTPADAITASLRSVTVPR